MKGIPKLLPVLLACSILLSFCKKENKDDKQLANVDCTTIAATYAANVKPIITGNCLSSNCHNASSGNGDFTTYNGLKAKADNGSLSNRIISSNNMPPSSGLSLDDRKKIKCWLSSGSPNN